MKDLKAFFKKDSFNLLVIILSFVILVIGIFVVNFLIAFITFVAVNLIWFIPFIKWRGKLDDREKKKKENKVKKKDADSSLIDEGDEAEKISVALEERSDLMAKKGRGKKKGKKKLGKKILLGFLIFFLICIIAGIAFFIFIAVTAGKFDPDKLYSKEASTLLDSDGEVFAKLGTQMRQKIDYEDMSEELVNAIVATEDSRFFEHNGFDLPRFMKASFGQLLGQNAGGASTLTMQVSKNQYTSAVSSGFAGIKRKFTDIYISMFQIEPNYSKEEILEFYANSYYLGSGAYGVEQAAETYFNKEAKDLNLSEAAMIAGLFQSPVSYDPNINPEKTESRRLVVLSLMKRHGYITDKEYEIAKKMTVDKIVIKGQSANTSNAKYQSFIDRVAKEVSDKTGYDPYSYSMKIYTTMDREQQDKISAIMDGSNYNWENDKVQAGIIAMETKTGEIVAIGGGRNKTDARSYNNATDIHKQIGSTAKPLYDYGPAIEYLDWNTDYPIIDDKTTYSDGTEINNWDGRYKGIITIRQALVESRNIPALKTFQSVPNSDIKDFVTKLGLSPEVQSNGKLHEAHAIGGYGDGKDTGESPMTVAAAYAAFGNGGTYNEPHTFTKVVFDESGETYENDYEKTKVMSPETAYMVTDMLVDTGQDALGRYNNINGAQFAAKTGTTNYDEATMEARNLPSNAVNDLWVAGYNSEYSIAVWYGYENLNDGYNRFGSSQNSRLFQTVAKNFFDKDVKFEKPDSVVEVTVERNTGYSMLPSENTPNDMKTTELFKEDSKPTEVSARFNTLSNVSDLKATVSGNRATVSWKAIDTPDALNRSYWSPLVEKAFALSKDQNTYLSYIMSFNSGRLGNVVYNIYSKVGDKLTLLTTVSGTSATVKLPNTSSPTLVVKASYSNFSGAESSGTEVKVDYEGVAISDVKATLNGDANISLDINAIYTEPVKPVTVTLDGEDITDECEITLTVTDSSGTPVSNWKTVVGKTAESYTFSYKVTYQGETVTTLTRTVTVS